MYNRSTARLLHWLKVPPEPQAPFGDPASLRVFRAGKNYFKLRLAGWALGQIAALVGVIFWAFLFVHIEERARIERGNRAAKAEAAAAMAAAAAASASSDSSALAENSAGSPEAQPPAKKAPRAKRERVRGWAGFELALVELALRLPLWAFPVLWAVKVLGFLIYALQVPLTYSVVRLDYELRWYVVTDRSLRIRSGVWSVQELTMSFANLQQVVVSQGPVQRLLKLADVRVQSAGGGGGGGEGRGDSGSHDDSLHTGLFHGVENAEEIRDLILSRLKRFRETGLGDPDERVAGSAPQPSVGSPAANPPALGNHAAAVVAARELAAEARALREMIS